MSNKSLGLFEGVGIEIEYMIVNSDTLEIQPKSDLLLQYFQNNKESFDNEVELGEIAMSNELVMHVIELKTNGPKRSLKNLDTHFHEQISKINDHLSNHNCKLMPTGTHPFLEPANQNIKLWPYGDKSIYDTYNKIFGCQGHGWSNLQSMHINLPFSNDEEFHKLHSAIRLVLPAIPALTASTPIFESKVTESLDNRLAFYGQNQASIPEISGSIIPEYIINKKEYKEKILHPMYKAISKFDPNRILQHEWLNSRGAIARFDRNAIEIRIVDSQESPLADIACAATIIGLLKYLIDKTDLYLTSPIDEKSLQLIYKNVIKDGFNAKINNPEYWKMFNIEQGETAKDFWRSVAKKIEPYMDPAHFAILEQILKRGSLAEKIRNQIGSNTNKDSISQIYNNLADCLSENRLYV